MSLANDIATQEAENTNLKTERDSLKDQVAKQRGAIMESRAQNELLIKRNEQLAAQIARYDKHFRDALASGEAIIKHRGELSEPPVPPPAIEPERPTLKARLSRLRPGNTEGKAA